MKIANVTARFGHTQELAVGRISELERVIAAQTVAYQQHVTLQNGVIATLQAAAVTNAQDIARVDATTTERMTTMDAQVQAIQTTTTTMEHRLGAVSQEIQAATTNMQLIIQGDMQTHQTGMQAMLASFIQEMRQGGGTRGRNRSPTRSPQRDFGRGGKE